MSNKISKKKVIFQIIGLITLIFAVSTFHYYTKLNKIKSGEIEICADVNKSQIQDYMYDDNGNIYVFVNGKWINATCEGE
jgi:hypothetical protein